MGQLNVYCGSDYCGSDSKASSRPLAPPQRDRQAAGDRLRATLAPGPQRLVFTFTDGSAMPPNETPCRLGDALSLVLSRYLGAEPPGPCLATDLVGERQARSLGSSTDRLAAHYGELAFAAQ